MDILKNVWNRIDEYVEENGIWLMPVVLINIFVGFAFVVNAIPDPKPDADDLEAVKKYIVKMEYEGHMYLVYKRNSYTAMCHDENCKCREQ